MKSIIITVILTFLSIVVPKTETDIFKCASELKLDTCYIKNVKTDTEKTTTKYLDACSKGKYCVESDSGPMSMYKGEISSKRRRQMRITQWML